MTTGVKIDLFRSVTAHGIETIADIGALAQENDMIRLKGEAVQQFCKLIVGCFDHDPNFETKMLEIASKAREIRFSKEGNWGGGNLGSMMGFHVDYIL